MLNSSARYTVCEASTKTGKTASHIIWLLEQAIKGKENQNFWWVAPVYGQAKIAFTRMKFQISDKDFFKANETDLTLILPNGAVIWFKSAEKPDNLYGEDVYAAVFDEFTRAREASWFALRTTLSSTGGKCKFIGNVRGKKNWGYKLAQKAKNGEPNHQYFKITAYDAANEGMLTKDGQPFLNEIEQAKRDLPEHVFNELYLAEANEDASNPFGLSFIAQCTFPISNLPAVCYGVDVARSFDWTVIIGLDMNCQVCYFDRFQRDWRQTTQAIVNLPNVLIAIDGTGVGGPIGEDVGRVKNVDIVIFTQHSKQQMMEALALAIQQRRITFPEGVITDELSNFEYEYTRTGVKYSAPSGLHDDAVCALALALTKWKSGGTGQYSYI
jgi:phage FluMu gp28-like protein